MQALQREEVGVGVADRRQLQPFEGAGDAHVLVGKGDECLLAWWQLSVADLLAFIRSGGVEELARDAGR
ncbi:hypothetical protein D3C73_731700 [compost metagenome]